MSDAHGVARDQLRSFIERVERLEEEKKTIADDIKDVYGEAKGMGFEPKILKEVIKIRKMDKDERMEREAILDTYLAALGMIEQPDFFADEQRRPAPVDRKARAALRTSEAMDDNKAFSAQLVADGLISEEAHRENIALSDAVARKYGVGVINLEKGEILEEQNTQSDAAPTSDAVISPSNDSTGEVAPSLPDNSPETANETDAANEAGVIDPSADRVSPTDGSDVANPGGGDVDGGAMRAGPLAPASKNGEGRQNALPDRRKSKLRPNCLQPEMCRSGTRDHCYSCRKSMTQEDAA